MEDEILKAYEPAARIYCEKVGADPDKKFADFTDISAITQEPRMKPAWHRVAYELHDLSVRMVSMREAANLPKVEVH